MQSHETKAWLTTRLIKHRSALETLGGAHTDTEILRARIDELKALQAALDNPTPPVWIESAE